MLAPQQVVNLLFGVGDLVSNLLVCSHQPLHVEHNRSFIVDLKALKSHGDIKCDDSGSWTNNSCNKFKFNNDGNQWVLCEDCDSSSCENQLTLKRTYFRLKDGRSDDFRRRIDLIQCMSANYC